MIYTGGCYCGLIRYSFDVSPDEARTSLCNCHNCKVRSALLHSFPASPLHTPYLNTPQKFFGTNYGLTTKIPASLFKLTKGTPKVHEDDNGSGSLLHREFCGACGGAILEYGVRISIFWKLAGQRQNSELGID